MDTLNLNSTGFRIRPKIEGHCVYLHIRKDNNEPYYVGEGNSNRPFDKSNRSKQWKEFNETYGTLVEIIKSNITKDEALDIEANLIEKYGRLDNNTGILINNNNGGIGNKGEDNYFHNKHLFGKDNGNYGNKFKSNPLSKAILVIDIHGNIIEEFESISHAEENGYDGSCISSCCLGNRKLHKNKQFVFKEDYNENKDYSLKRSKTHPREVVQFGFNNTIINVFDKASEFTKLGFNSNNIQQCCSGLKKMHRHFRFAYTDTLSKELKLKVEEFKNAIKI